MSSPPRPLPAAALPQGCGHAQRRRLFRFPSSRGRRHCRSLPALPSRAVGLGLAVGRLPTRGSSSRRSLFRPLPARAARLPRAAPQPPGARTEAPRRAGTFPRRVSGQPGRDRGPRSPSSFLVRGLAGAGGPGADLPRAGPGPPPPARRAAAPGRWLIVCSGAVSFSAVAPGGSRRPAGLPVRDALPRPLPRSRRRDRLSGWWVSFPVSASGPSPPLCSPSRVARACCHESFALLKPNLCHISRS